MPVGAESPELPVLLWGAEDEGGFGAHVEDEVEDAKARDEAESVAPYLVVGGGGRSGEGRVEGEVGRGGSGEWRGYLGGAVGDLGGDAEDAADGGVEHGVKLHKALDATLKRRQKIVGVILEIGRAPVG